MHVDHLTYAAGPEGLKATVERLEEQLGGHFRDGGFHPRFGTRNHILPLADSRYLEVVEVLDHPASFKAAYGQAVRARSEMGGGWLAWVLTVDDLAPLESRLGRQSVEGSRRFPDGRELVWKQLGVRGVMADPQLPYFVQFTSPEDVLPRALPGTIKVEKIELTGNRKRVEDWIGQPLEGSIDGVDVEIDSEHGHPSLSAVTFECEKGTVRL